MKIVFLLPHIRISGGTRIILNYAHQLSLLGHQVFVCVQDTSLIRGYLKNFLNLKPVWFKNFGGKIKRIVDFSQKNIPEADILIADSWEIAFKTKDIACNKKFHFIQHDERLYHGDAKKVAETYKLPFKKIVVSSWLKEVLKNEFNQEAELLLNPFDRNLFYKIDGKRRSGEIRVLVLDHPYKWKGTDEGIEIVNNLKKKYPMVKLIGFGARRDAVSFLYDEYYYNLDQNKLAGLYSSCDIFLCPSWDEGFGLPSVEAMACGCALVTYDNGGSRDFAFDGETALVAKRKDKIELENKLEMLVKDKDLRAKIAEKGYNFVNQTPDWKQQTEKLIKFLEKEK